MNNIPNGAQSSSDSNESDADDSYEGLQGIFNSNAQNDAEAVPYYLLPEGTEGSTEQDRDQISSDYNSDSDPSGPQLSSGSDSAEGPAQPKNSPSENSSEHADNELKSYNSDPDNVERDESVPESQRGLDSDDVKSALDEHVGLSQDFVEDVELQQERTRAAAKVGSDLLESSAVNNKGEPVITPEVVEQLKENVVLVDNIAQRIGLAVTPAEDIIEQTDARGLMTPERRAIQDWSINQQRVVHVAERMGNNSQEVIANVLAGNPDGVHDPRLPVTRDASIRAWLQGTNTTYSPGSSEVRPVLPAPDTDVNYDAAVNRPGSELGQYLAGPVHPVESEPNHNSASSQDEDN